jgi:hypothetical protein
MYLGISENGDAQDGCDLETTLERHKYFDIMEHDTMWGPFRLLPHCMDEELFCCSTMTPVLGLLHGTAFGGVTDIPVKRAAS